MLVMLYHMVGGFVAGAFSHAGWLKMKAWYSKETTAVETKVKAAVSEGTKAIKAKL